MATVNVTSLSRTLYKRCTRCGTEGEQRYILIESHWLSWVWLEYPRMFCPHCGREADVPSLNACIENLNMFDILRKIVKTAEKLKLDKKLIILRLPDLWKWGNLRAGTRSDEWFEETLRRSVADA